ncbi:MAG: TfoX/Sxy family protein [Candidatus Heimdallarchaeota archaeon]
MSSKWDKPSQDLIDLLDMVLTPYEHTKRKMFGSPSYFVNNNMFAGVHEDVIFLRLSENDREELLEYDSDAEHFDPLEGRPMREYMVITEGIYRDVNLLEKWISKSIKFASSLPPKQHKKKKT